MANKDFKEIMEDIQTDFAASNIPVNDFYPGSLIRTMSEIFAWRMDEAYGMLQQQLNLFFVATSSGEYLEARVAEESIERDPGKCATGQIMASRSTPAPFTENVPVGTRFTTEDGVVIETTADCTYAQGETEVVFPARSVFVGTNGNLKQGVSLKQVGIAVALIETTVVSSKFSGGLDIESDDSLRLRYFNKINNVSGAGNQDDYEIWAQEIQGVGPVLVEPEWQGEGTVRVIIRDTQGRPATPELVTEVQEHLDPGQRGLGEGRAPVGSKVTVVTTSVYEVQASIPGLVIEPGYTLDQAQLNATTALTTYLLSITAGGTIRIREAESAIVNATGVLDIGDITLDGTRNNIVLDVDKVADLGGVAYV